ncbi:hypothetical protein CLV78_104130 [Aliiruegeria haliotis]|uniref:Uncharacterized protein n=1 Tax=Aliiruegeria haliotis TaxID=1280846 RepID=A0A2T0RR20_9RHOB|nr:hypothetical protein [Aliiruegeria haliotis]PRY23639.1 hypothetical protein CLV78_104130 [Aliiruegeria haliotis]
MSSHHPRSRVVPAATSRRQPTKAVVQSPTPGALAAFADAAAQNQFDWRRPGLAADPVRFARDRFAAAFGIGHRSVA